ncbi:MAG: threonine/serine dehydratase [Tissierellia bacterium]|nr:threonine/serine dehydratase [Tissierellia bacterium]
MEKNLIYQDIIEARELIRDHIIKTPLLRVKALDKILNTKVYLKCENLQITNSFKLRGALNALLHLSDEQKSCGIVASSSGNHAQGIAYAAKKLNIDAKIVMPVNSNIEKLNRVKSQNVPVILYGKNSSQRDEEALRLVNEENRVFIHPFKNFYVKAGQGTMALEILEDLEPDNIFVPIGGGGMISGVSTAIKTVNKNIKVYGVEPKNAARYSKSLKEGRPIVLDSNDTIADGTRTDSADKTNFEIIKSNVDKILNASEESILKAIGLIAKEAKLIAEPSAVLGISAVLDNNIKLNRNEKSVFILSAGNIDYNILKKAMEN